MTTLVSLKERKEETRQPAGAETAADERPVAVVDIGSNSVRLVIYDKLSRAPFPRFNEKSLCALGSELDTTGRLPDAGIACTVQALRRYCRIARAMEVERFDILATEAVRRASNGAVLTSLIESKTGHEVHLLDGEAEARLAALGVAAGFFRPTGVVGDFGGGSLELSELEDGLVGERFVSLPLGALRIAAMTAEGGDARQRIDALLAERGWSETGTSAFYVVGGGWRALARVHAAMTDAPIKVAHGLEIGTREARRLAKAIARMSPSEVAALPGVPTRRVATLPAAALAFDRVLKHLKPQRVVFSALGLREGWLYTCLDEAARAEDPLVVGARELGRPRARVHWIGEAMVRWTAHLFAGESEVEHRLRVAACEVSDIGWRDHQQVRAIESFTRLAQFPFVGLDHAERAFIAGAIHARYGGRGDEPEVAPALALLDAASRRRALVLGRALQLGYRFSGSVPELLDGARLKLVDGGLELLVTSLDTLPDSDTVRDRLRNLAKALGVERTDIRKTDALA